MPNFFQSLFNRQINVNVYSNQVNERYSFDELSFAQLEALYVLLPDVRIIEDFIGDNIAKIEVDVVNSRGTVQKNTDLNQLIEQTNSTQAWYEFVKESFVSFGLTGNTFIYRDPEMGYLYNLPTSATRINLGKNKDLPEFLNYVSSYTMQMGGLEYHLQDNYILHIKAATLLYEYGLWSLGTSPYQAGTKNIKTLEANYSSRVSTIRDRGALGIISNESDIPDQEQSRLVQDALETYGTREEQKKFAVTTQKLTYQQMALGVAELQLIENLKVDFNKLCQLQGLDPLIFSSEGSTYANQLEARKAAIKNVIIPRADKYYSKLNEFLRPYYGGLRIEPNYDSLPEYGEINTELSQKVIDEVSADIITIEQGHEILYPDLPYIEPEPEVIVEPETPDEDAVDV